MYIFTFIPKHFKLSTPPPPKKKWRPRSHILNVLLRKMLVSRRMMECNPSPSPGLTFLLQFVCIYQSKSKSNLRGCVAAYIEEIQIYYLHIIDIFIYVSKTHWRTWSPLLHLGSKSFLSNADKLNLKIIESNFDQIWLIKVPKNPHLTLDPYPIPPAFWAPFQ